MLSHNLFLQRRCSLGFRIPPRGKTASLWIFCGLLAAEAIGRNGDNRMENASLVPP